MARTNRYDIHFARGRGGRLDTVEARDERHALDEYARREGYGDYRDWLHDDKEELKAVER